FFALFNSCSPALGMAICIIFDRMKYTLLLLLFSYCLFGQVVKFESDTVIVYCKFGDLIQAIHKEYCNAPILSWETLNGKKVEVKTYVPNYQDSLLALKKTKNDTMVLPYDESIFDELKWEIKSLAKEYKLSFFDKRNNKRVTRVKKTVTGKRHSILFNVYIDAETKNILYWDVKKTWQEF